MAGYLGDTNVFFTFAGGLARIVTFDGFHADTDAHGQVFYTGDFVEGDHALQSRNAAYDTVGTWLTRASIDDAGCSRVAPGNCDVGGIPPLPEPETWLLTGAGLIGLLMWRSRVRD